MKSMIFRSWLLVLPSLLLWAGAAHSTSCLNNLPPSNPDEVYIDHGDGTVTDTRSGLMWKQRAEDTWTGVTWGDALARARASTFAGYTDWRLPNVKELSSLVEECQRSPAINRNLFPGVSGDVWSGSPSSRDPRFFYSGSWYVSFSSGTTNSILRSYPAYVLLVRGGQ